MFFDLIDMNVVIEYVGKTENKKKTQYLQNLIQCHSTSQM